MSSPLRVLVISHPAVAPIYRRKFALVQESGDVHVRLIVPEAWPEGTSRVVFDPSDAPEWVTALPIAFEGYYTRYFYKRGLAAPFRDLRPEIVHVEEEPYSLSAGQALWMLQRHAPDARFIFRSSISEDIRLKRFAVPFLRRIERRVFRRADSAFVLSRRAEEVMRRHGYRGEARIFPNGVDVAVFRPLAEEVTERIRAELDLSGRYVVGYVGRLTRLKGIETLLDAAAELGNVDVLLVGEGEHRAALEKHAIALGIRDRVRFTGAQPPPRVAELLNAMDLFVLPSRTSPVWVEFFGRAAVEAMACGVPVIGSSSGEIPNTIGDAGIVFPEGNAKALAASIDELRSHPHRCAELRARGIRRVRERFAWEAVAEQTRQAYFEIARRG